MIELSQSELQELATHFLPPCISMYMPAEKAGAETRKNPIRFKNLLSEAEEKLAKGQQSESKTQATLESAKSYLENHDFWQHQDSGLAFFLDGNGIKYYRLPHSFEEVVVIGDRFYLKPLLPLITNDSKFYLLALSQNEVKLFWGNHYNIRELNLPESVPPSLAEALKYDDPEKQLQYHSGDSGSNPVYHGQGVGNTDNKDEIKRFFQKIDRGLTELLQAGKTPLILAGVEYLLPIYHEANSYGNLVEEGITGNPENVSAADLHQQAWDIMKPKLATVKQEALDKYHQLASTGETSNKLEEIVAAAVNGQIDTLFLVVNTQKWGKFEPEANKVEIHSEVNDDSVDLIDLAATDTFWQGGEIYYLDREQMPEDPLMMAILRYPVYAPVEKVNA